MNCPTPIRFQDGRIVPCGYCEFCTELYRKQWAFRLEQEQSHAKSSHFLTLTYEDETLPLAPYQFSDHPDDFIMIGNLVKKDLQNFMKKVRNNQYSYNSGYKKRNPTLQEKMQRIRYFAVGEYGSKTLRPHYHMILFNINKKVLHNLDNLWPMGFIKVGSVTPASINYVAGYVMTKGQYPGKPFQKPFAIMSRNPGIGARYRENNNKYHAESLNTQVITKDGFKVSIPRYYRDRFFTSEEKDYLKDKAIQNSYDDYNSEIEKLSKKHECPYSYRREQIEQRKNRLIKKQTKGKSL